MSRTAQQANLARTIAADIAKMWPAYQALIDELATPTVTGTSSGRPSGISDPTGSAAAAGEPFTQQRREQAAKVAAAVATLRAVHHAMANTLAAATAPRAIDVRCNGLYDDTCTELASVGPTGRTDRGGACIRCYTAERRAKANA